ncbi:tyrosine-type recombinase/integrase [Ralstonia nicotianae]
MLLFAYEATGSQVECIDLSTIECMRQAHAIRGTRFDIAMSFVVPWLRRWTEAAEPGIAKEVNIYLSDTNGSFEGRSYVALRTNDPERGPLTQLEMNSLIGAMNEYFADGRVSLLTYALMWLFIGTGVRPIQIARMRVGDVRFDEVPGSTDVYLFIPLAKGEGAYEGQRWGLRAPTVVAEVLRAYIEHYKLNDPAGPLFPDARNSSVPVSIDTLKNTVRRVGERLKVFTSRLDGPIPLFPYRFRYTVGTRAVELGANDHVVARLLTHRTTWSIKHYRAATAAGQRTVIGALGDELETIHKAFRGTIVTDLSDATRAGEAQALIRDFERLTGRSMGACGTRVECLQLTPIACLTCRHFEAFEDAPFEELRSSLKAEQEEEGELKIRQIYDEPIAALDDLIQRVRLEGVSQSRVQQ